MLFTDAYQLTMAQLYFRAGWHDRTAQFEHFFRRYPDYGSHQAGYCIAAGLSPLLEWMSTTRITEDDLAVLAAQTDGRGDPLFGDDFLAWLRDNGHFEAITIRAVPEGRVVHARAPMTIVQGPLAMTQILETALLNRLNFETLIATKSSRVVEAARGRPVLEFGLRRSAGRGGNAASRAALVGGASATSNVGVAALTDTRPIGTHAHSLIQAHMALGLGELGAFRAYADVYPNDCTLLVDTINTLGSGIPNAITVFEELRSRGHEPVGVRLDSGDLAYLAVQAARLLNDGGFPDVSIVLSSSLDELVILQILTQIEQEASQYGVDPQHLIGRLVFGVGSKLSTSSGHPYLDGVYKLVAIQADSSNSEASWRPAIKVSDTPAKIPNPGDKDLYRIYDTRGQATADLIAVAGSPLGESGTIVLHHPTQPQSKRTLERSAISRFEPLLERVYVEGRVTDASNSIEEIQQRRLRDLARLDPGVRRLVNPHLYHVSLTEELWDLKQRLINEARGSRPEGNELG